MAPRTNARRDFPAAAEAAHRADQAAGRRAPRVLLLCGLPGCGKSTLALQLLERGWCRINQDELGTRADCERDARKALLAGHDVVIDRCNFDAAQRAPWIELAQQRHCSIGVILFKIPLAVCVSRVQARRDHPTLPANSPQSAGVVKRMHAQFRAPTQGEGLDYCRVVDKDTDPLSVAKSVGLF
jgi:predicted kinase